MEKALENYFYGYNCSIFSSSSLIDSINFSLRLLIAMLRYPFSFSTRNFFLAATPRLSIGNLSS